MHIPVLFNEAIAALNPNDGDHIIDATFGGGGHSTGILDSANCFVYAIDRDEDALSRAQALQQLYQCNGKQHKNRLLFYNGCFGDVLKQFKQNGKKFDGILFDFGVSSFQIDQHDRGFSFTRNGNLDMRMSRHDIELTAYDVVNNYSKNDLTQIIRTYGDEKMAHRIATAIVNARDKTPIDAIRTTHQLRDIVHDVYGIDKANGIDTATKTFQAIRIYINDELRQIQTALDCLRYIMNDGARIVTIAFHSLEDRIVKHWYLNNKTREDGDILIEQIGSIIRPSKEEIKNNVRSRSAIMRRYIMHSG